MPLYEFEAADGSVHEWDFPMSRAPKFGAWRTRKGIRACRVPSRHRPNVKNWGHVSRQLPKFANRAQAEKMGMDCDEGLRPRFANKAKMEQFAAMSGGRFKFD